MVKKQLNIAVVGCGAAGVVAAHYLSQTHKVTLFEKNSYLGGHTNTIIIPSGPDKGTPVDTGFIVCNTHNYPTLHQFFKELGVNLRFSDMSFAFWDTITDFKYASHSIRGIFVHRKNIFSLNFWKLLRKIKAFLNKCRRDLIDGNLTGISLAQYIEREKLSPFFVDSFLLPLGSSIWSMPFKDVLEFPAESMIRFYEQHGVLSFGNGPRWQTVIGGSHSYIKAFQEQFSGDIHLNTHLQGISRGKDHVKLSFKDGQRRVFDKVVIGTHADEALKLLSDPSELEKNLLGKWHYQANKVVLHHDASLMPKQKRAWASWNYHREDSAALSDNVSMTYQMNRLQGLKTHESYLVTLNTHRPIAKDKIIKTMTYHHPLFTREAMDTQAQLPELNGVHNTYFCGSYFGYGFHEDAALSGLKAAEQIGF